eukprot:jgi/Picsp_1/2108/NSC_05573-R1_ccch zinc finger domain protein
MVAKKIDFHKVHEVEFIEDSGFFFHRLRELKISKRSDGKATKFWFALSPVHGVMFLSSNECLYSLETSRAHCLSTKIEDSDASSELESVFDVGSIQPVAEHSSSIEFMALRDDGTLLLVCCQNEIHVYQANDLLQQAADPLLTYKVEGVKLGAWEPNKDLKSAPGRLAILTESGSVKVLDISQPPEKCTKEIVAENAGAFCWHPSGGKIAVGQGGKISIIDSIDGSVDCEILLRTEGGDDSDRLWTDGIIWLLSSLLYATCTIFRDGFNDSVPLFVSCDGSMECSKGYKIAELYPSEVAVRGTSRQCLVGASVQEWDVIVSSHRGYLDDHIKVFSFANGNAEFASITEDALSIRIPNGPDDTENHVLTLGIDKSSDSTSCPHPIDKNADDLQNLPRVWILTSDGILREYIFGSLTHESCAMSKKMLHRYEGQIWSSRSEVIDSSREGDLLTAINVELSGSDDDFDDLTEPEDVPGTYKLPEAQIPRPDAVTLSTLSRSTAENGIEFGSKLEAQEVKENAKAKDSVESRDDQLDNGDLESLPFPESRISHLKGDFPGIERDFMSTLFESRKMEFICYTKLSAILQDTDLPALREETLKLLSFCLDTRGYLRLVREGLNVLISNATRAYARIEAMPHFYPRGERKLEHKGHGDKLDTKLYRLKERIKSRIKACRFAAEDLQETISCLVEQSPKQCQSDGFGGYSQYITLKDSIVSQDHILKLQIDRVERLYKKADDLSIMSNLRMPPIPSPSSGVTSNSSLHISPIYNRLKWVSLNSFDLSSPGSKKQAGMKQHQQLKPNIDLMDTQILERCIGRTGEVRKTIVSPTKQLSLARSSDLPPMKEIGVPKLPEPFKLPTFSSAQIKKSNAKALDDSNAVKSIPLRIRPTKDVAQLPLPSFAQQAEAKSLVGKAGLADSTKPKPVSKIAQPPLPSFAQQAEAKSLVGKAGLADSTKPKPVSKIAQPPLPSFAQQAEAKSLVGKAGLADSTKPKPVSKIAQPPLPSFAQQAEATSLVESFKSSNKEVKDVSSGNQYIQIQKTFPGQQVDSSMGEGSGKVIQEQNLGASAGRTEESRIGKSPEFIKASKPINSGARSDTFPSYTAETKNIFSQTAPNLEADASNATSFQGAQDRDPKSLVVPQADAKGTTAGSSLLLGDASTGVHNYTSSGQWPSSSSDTFNGSLKPVSTAQTFGQPLQAGIEKSTAFGQSTGGFGQPSSLGQTATSPFGQPSGFGQPSQVGYGSTSTFGQSTGGFGQPSSLGQAATSPFGQPSGFGQPSQVGFGSTSSFAQPTGGFGQEPNQATSAFGAMSSQKNVFAQYAQQNQGAFGSSPGSFQRPKDSNSSMWQARK